MRPIWKRPWANIRPFFTQIKQIDPSFVDNPLLPADGIADLTWEGHNELIDNLRMERAVAYYRVRGDIEPLQLEALRYLQKTVDSAYDQAVSMADADLLNPKLSRERAIGVAMDGEFERSLAKCCLLMKSPAALALTYSSTIATTRRSREVKGIGFRTRESETFPMIGRSGRRRSAQRKFAGSFAPTRGRAGCS